VLADALNAARLESSLRLRGETNNEKKMARFNYDGVWLVTSTFLYS